MSAPLATVCIPTYNGAPWLAECLESALAQTVDELEILVVDDRSSDGTIDIAREFAVRDSRIVVEQNSDRLGLAPNWNRCAGLARGDWIKFLFQDDLLAPACVERMVQAGSNGAAIVLCDRGLDFAPDTEDRIRDYFAELPRMDDVFGTTASVPAADVCRALVAHPGVNFLGEPSSVLLNRVAFAGAGGFNTRMIQLCDLELWARLSCKSGLVRVREQLATLRIHGKSTSSSNAASQQFRKDVLDTLILYHEFAFADGFAALREVVGSRFSRLAAVELRRAQRDVREADDPDLRRELQTVMDDHPKLGRPLWLLWHRLRKTLGSAP